MPLETSAAFMLDLLPPRLAEGCTPPFAELKIEALPKAQMSQRGLLTCGIRRTSIPVISRNWRTVARRIVRLADAAACDLNLLRTAQGNMKIVELPSSATSKRSGVSAMPEWAWKINGLLLEALQDLGVCSSEILRSAVSQGSTITLVAGSGTPGLYNDVKVTFVGRFPIIEILIELQPGLRLESKESAILTCNQRFPSTAVSTLRGKPLKALMKVGSDAIESIAIENIFGSSRSTRVKLESVWAQLAPVPDEIVLGLRSDMQEWFSLPQWGRNPALLSNALRLLS